MHRHTFGIVLFLFSIQKGGGGIHKVANSRQDIAPEIAGQGTKKLGWTELNVVLIQIVCFRIENGSCRTDMPF